MMNRLTSKLGLLTVMTMLFIVTACGQANTGNTANTGNNEAAGSTNTAATQAPEETQTPENKGTLTVYLNDFDEIIKPMFEEATGYKLELVTGNGAEIMSRIEAEKGNPHWDVVWMDAMPSINALGQQGQLLEGWEPANAAGLTDFAKSFIPANGAYYPTGAHAAGVIVYNTNEVKAEDAPKTWKELADSKYAKMIGMADPAIAAPAYPFVAWFFQEQGMDGGKSYFESLMSNGLSVYPKNPNVVKALAAGEIKMAALQESNAYAMKNSGEPIEIIWPEEGAPASVRVAAIQKDTKNVEAAKAFVEFILDPNTQRALIDQGEESYFEPSANGVNAKSDRAQNAKLVAAKADWASEHEAEIKQWFSDQSVK